MFERMKMNKKCQIAKNDVEQSYSPMSSVNAENTDKKKCNKSDESQIKSIGSNYIFIYAYILNSIILFL